MEKEAFISSLLKLKVQDNYYSPLGELNTRRGLNRKSQQVTSRLDYCLSNLNTSIALKFHHDISDHCLFLIESEICLSRRKKTAIIQKEKDYSKHNFKPTLDDR